MFVFRANVTLLRALTMQNDRGRGDNHNCQPYGGGDAGTDPKLFVATTLAALVLAGSAYIWRSGTIPMLRSRTGEIFRKENSDSIGGQSMPVDAGPSRSPSSSSRMGKNNMDAGDSRTSGSVGQASSKKRHASQLKQQLQHGREDAADNRFDAGGATAVGGSLGKASRPKERRWRGKNPTKEPFKSGKLNTTKASGTTRKPKSLSPSSSSRGQQASTTPRLQRRTATRSTSRSRSPSRTLDPISASLQPSSRSRSRSPLGTRRRGTSSGHDEDVEEGHRDPVFAFDSLTTTSNRDYTTSTSSASSTAATEATTFSTTSTAPS
ncbi:hypothetical protein BKA70DRAFT_541021 [Coprinopsis sp. MPI-PUGE-AT-0042]|nr:hypothetical protein BKA70DRAFT_541021 [Coprinopsis sp. MPI-PUGE-AT-0042]